MNGDTFSIIFGYLPLCDRARCLPVCREWLAWITKWSGWTYQDCIDSVTKDYLYFIQINTHLLLNDELLCIAAEYGRVRIVKFLLSIRPHDYVFDKIVTEHAAYGCNAQVIKLFLDDPRTKALTEFKSILKYAAVRGNAGLMTMLLSDTRIMIHNTRVLYIAITSGNINAVKVLLDDGRINPAINNNEALLMANMINNKKIIKLLRNDPRVQAVGNGM